MNPDAVLSKVLAPPPGPLRRVWPALAGLAAILVGIAALVMTSHWKDTAMATTLRTKEVKAELALARTRALGRKSGSAAAALEVPPSFMQLSDVESLIRVAEQQKVKLGSLQFRTEPVPNTPYVVRTAEFRVEEEYPRIKGFLAELLGRVPHLYLGELRVDQTAQADGKVLANVRLSFVYLAARSKP